MASADSEPKPGKAPARRARNRNPGTSVWNHALIALAVAAAGLVCAVGILWFQLVESSNEAFRQQQTKTLSSQFSGYFNSRISSLRTEVAALANAPQTVAALTSYDPQIMQHAGHELSTILGFAERVTIIPKGEGAVDLDAAVPISFAALDVIRRAEQQSFVGPEIALNQRNLVYAAAPILSDGSVAGVLFVALSASYFSGPLAAYDQQAGQTRIIQTLDESRPEQVFTFGTGDSPQKFVTTQLASPTWRLEFEPNLANIVPIASLSKLMAAIAVIMAFVLGGVMLAFSRLSRNLKSDSGTLLDDMSRLMRGRSAGTERYQLTLFQELASSIAQLDGADRASDRGPDEVASSAKPGAAAARAAKAAKASNMEELLDDTDQTDALLVEDTPEESEAPGPDKLAKRRDNDFLNLANDASENFGIEVSEDVGPLEAGVKLDDEIFRAYDIRGITTTNLTEDVVYWIGRAFAAECRDHQQTRVAVGRDGRHSSLALRNALARGLNEGGVDVLDVGQVPTPLLYFATHALDTGTGIMITGSHNPPEYNGLKMMIAGVTLADERIQRLKQRLYDNDLPEGDGALEIMELDDAYLDRILEDVVVAQPLKVVVDCGNGVAGVLAPRLLQELGCDVVPLYCDVDGDFPNHHPDPAEPKNLEDLIAVVREEKADLGLAFDGDGDRLGVVTGSGEIIWPDKLMMLFAQDVVGRNPGADILFDVKCSRHLNNIISDLGGRPIMWKTGHSHMKAKMKETGALLAGEFSGHICFGERWYGFDDALYSAARLLEILGAESRSCDQVFAQFPTTFATPEIKIQTTESAKFQIMERLVQEADFGEGTRTTIDGVRVDYADGWGLIRPSNTSPVLSLRFEADGQSALERIQDLFQTQLTSIDPTLRFR